ncbi:SusD-like starch-binding protein associating with outer membrane [Tenacibaculum adriaticum]|uniref:SusD-like starch-binding protein associating with outer membrane n=1 Tax=Tenacibaculum adriaticum TaxID=413713 RepID=A0A5S5DVK8_9FLAO|nr:RagB/SusD family nutrient uptake outer membrane protein [Tenacibaculum adriaticum]TYP99308.1 SusD-like starch-binding protein associating with outer membrane [Tenacibaculum adriaticum]
MKNTIKNILAVTLIIISVISCDDYLDIVPKGEQNSETYFNSQQDYEDALVGVYDLLGTNYLNHILGEIASDNSLCGGERPTDVLEWQQIDDMEHTPDNEALRNIWKWMYAGISRANYIVEFQNKTDFNRKAELLAENLFLRSYYYFELVKFFGDVPLFVDGRISVSQSQTIDRSPKADVYAQIEADLTSAINNLPWQQSQSGRATKGAALALLGKIYLYQKKYNEAADAFNKVITSGQYQLVTDFSTIFLNNNENNEESVFEIQYSIGVEGGSYENLEYSEGNVAAGFMSPRFTGDRSNWAPYDDGNTFSTPVQELVNQYDTEDTRLSATIFDMENFVASNPGVTFDQRNEYTGYYNHKYMVYQEANLPDTRITHGNNYRAIRYSDVLLMAAEANLLGTVQKNNPQDLLDEVRGRAFGDTDHRIPANIENVWRERRLEFAGEGHRFFDQVRTGKTSTIPGFQTEKNEVFPIPRIEIELAGNRWCQNKGYATSTCSTD